MLTDTETVFRPKSRLHILKMAVSRFFILPLRDYYAIPVTSVPSEPVFSIVRKLRSKKVT